jgi:sphingolipid delta-4 desaturase
MLCSHPPQKFHIEHHKHFGEDGIDTDLPTHVDLLLLNNVLGKIIFATFQILFYPLRPGFVHTQTPTVQHGINLVVQLSFDYFVAQAWGPCALTYLMLSSFFAGSLHPLTGHFIAEHYLWDGLP